MVQIRAEEPPGRNGLHLVKGVTWSKRNRLGRPAHAVAGSKSAAPTVKRAPSIKVAAKKESLLEEAAEKWPLPRMLM